MVFLRPLYLLLADHRDVGFMYEDKLFFEDSRMSPTYHGIGNKHYLEFGGMTCELMFKMNGWQYNE